jgi:hypothetical protein
MKQRCKTEGCKERAKTRGMCRSHYASWYQDPANHEQIKRYKADIRPLFTCAVQGCEGGRHKPTKGFCPRHYSRFLKYGDPLAMKVVNRPRVIPEETSPTKLARILGVSRQRASQILKPHANEARAAVAYALRTGAITKPERCERCGTQTENLHAHHWDYHEALDVRWLCPPCHTAVHVAMRKQRKAEQAA